MLRPRRGDLAGMSDDPGADRGYQPHLFRKRHEIRRRYEPAGSVGKAQQGLEPGQARIAGVHDGLEEQVESLRRCGLTDEGFDAQTGLELRVHAGVEGSKGIPPGCLRGIERKVRVLEKSM